MSRKSLIRVKKELARLKAQLEELTNERWLDIEGWPNYRVSDQGRIMRRSGLNQDGKRRLPSKILSLNFQARNGGSYLYVGVNLGWAGNQTNKSVARLVLETFVGPCPPGKECRHLNDISTDCRLVNLTWGTRLENRQDAILNDRMARGERNGSAKLKADLIPVIRNRYIKGNRKHGSNAIARDYGVSPQTIWDVINGRTWC
jgi:hypothetical protein